jgi:hypothetical protein
VAGQSWLQTLSTMGLKLGQRGVLVAAH